jgi:hypothetical protein
VKLPESLLKGAFARWFCVQEWNSFIYIAAMEVSLEWKSEYASLPPGR